MEEIIGLVFPVENVDEVRLAELQADESTHGTTRRGIPGVGSGGLAAFDFGSARTSWFDTSGA